MSHRAPASFPNSFHGPLQHYQIRKSRNTIITSLVEKKMANLADPDDFVSFVNTRSITLEEDDLR